MKKKIVCKQTGNDDRESSCESRGLEVEGGHARPQPHHRTLWIGNLAIAALVMAVLLAALTPAQPVNAQSSASELIAAVNAYRSSYGLAAYSVDGTLMGQAQAQSDYQASIGTCTHARADGSGPGDHGISAENVACGAGLTAQGAIDYEWTDTLHSATLLGPDTGRVGAGATVKDGSVYYTLDVVRLTGSFTVREAPQQAGTPGATVPQSGTGAPIVTSTPNADGSIAHVIQYGETLIEICQAYGISLSDLYAINPGLNPANPKYNAGQVLIIQLAFTATPNYTPTSTDRPPTRTVRPSRTPTQVLTATATRGLTLTPFVPTPTPPPASPPLDDRMVGYGFIVVSAAGLIFVIIKGFLIKGKS